MLANSADEAVHATNTSEVFGDVRSSFVHRGVSSRRVTEWIQSSGHVVSHSPAGAAAQAGFRNPR